MSNTPVVGLNMDMVPVWSVPTSQLRPPATPESVAATPESVAATPESVAATPEPVAATPEPVAKRRLLINKPETIGLLKRWLAEIKAKWIGLIHHVGCPPNSDLEKTAILMLMGFVTQDSRHIATITNWNREWVRIRCVRARQYKIWCGNGLLKVEWLGSDTSDQRIETAFACDIMIINGEMEKKNGRYWLSQKGLHESRNHR